MSKDAKSGEDDENIGHYADQELAYAYLKVNDYDKALYHALAEYNRRPKNIGVNETLGWVYYKKGDFDNARKYMGEALKTKSQNPTLLCRAGLIYAKAGDKIQAKSFRKSFKNNPNIAENLRQEGLKTLQSL